MLRDKDNYVVLEGFLTALLKKDIIMLKVIKSEDSHKNDRFNKVILLVENNLKEKIIIEIQNDRHSFYIERLVLGSSKIYDDCVKQYTDCNNITKVISINILYFNLGNGDDYIYYGTTEFKGIHTNKTYKVKRKNLYVYDKGIEQVTFNLQPTIFPEYYLIDIEKFKDVVNGDLDEWIYFLKYFDIKNDFKSKFIQDASERIKVSRLSKQELKKYERYLTNTAIEKDIIETAILESRFEAKLELEKEKKLDIYKEYSIKGLKKRFPEISDDVINKMKQITKISVYDSIFDIIFKKNSLEDLKKLLDS